MRPPWNVVNEVVLAAVVVLFAIVAATGDSIDDEYLRRFKALEPTDVQGHFELAKWCREQQRWPLLAQQARHVLRISPNHTQAQLLLSIAQQRLSKDRPAGEGRPGDRGGDGDGPRLLTDDEVQRIRRAELRLDRDESIVVVVDRPALQKFFDEATAAGWITLDRREFFRLPRIQQAQLVLKYAPEKFGPAVNIRTDPERLHAFTRTVQPIILRGCATADCHGGPSARDFRLHATRTLSANATHANFLIMHEYQAGGERVINRDQPARSLLLTYGLPPAQGPDPQAPKHPTDIAPVFPDVDHRDYKAVLEWLSSLSIERPDYGIKTPD